MVWQGDSGYYHKTEEVPLLWDDFIKYISELSVVAIFHINYNRIDIRKGGIAYVQYLKIPPGDGGLISIRGLKRSLPALIY